MLYNLLLLCNLFIFTLANNNSYIYNNKSDFQYFSLPESNLINKNPRTYPFDGFACNEYYKKDNLNYLITSSQYPNFGYNTNENYKCSYTKKYIEILKYDSFNNTYMDSLLIGEKTNNYPDAIGDKGSDHIISCGIDNTLNILYYVTSNKYNCPSNYKTDSSLVRINLTDFSFIDRTIFNNFEEKFKFSTSNYYEYKYINAPSTTTLIENDSLWVGFGTSYGGIWQLNISTTPVEIIKQYQKKYMVEYEEEMFTGSQNNNYYETNIREIKKSFINKQRSEIYFIEDTGYNDAKVLIINYSNPINDNTTKIKILDGLNYISDIKLDNINENIYIIAGSINSELYKLDYEFNKQQLNENCDIDFLKFPPEWGVITNIQLDLITGYIYVIISTRYGQNGIVRINLKDMTLDMDSYIKFKIVLNHNQYSYYNYVQNSNISHINFEKGELLLLGNPYSWHNYIVHYKLAGCAKGRGIINNTCNVCLPGKFSNTIGEYCKDCFAGYANENFESYYCTKCEIGKYTNGEHTINCIDCPGGYFSENEGQNYCKFCENGTYSIIQGSTSKNNCIQCEDGKISSYGQTTCEFCDIGQWSKNNKICMGCSKGKYSNSLGLINDNECKLCSIGKYNNEIGLYNELECKICENGKIGIVEGATSDQSCILCDSGKYKESEDFCEICPDGWISNNKENKCDLCDAGKWAFDKKSCLDCPPGKYSFNIGISDSNDCNLCEIGKYQPNEGKTNLDSCISCEKGKIGIIGGATSNSSCVTCDFGKYKASLDFCEICPDGWISNNKENKCDLCDAGKWAFDKKSCVDCPPGKYSFNIGISDSKDCDLCEIGKFQPNEGETNKDNCISCENGKIGIISGASSNSSCISCDFGKFKSNLFTCELCPDGWISNNKENKCNLCQPGKWAFDKKSCVDCPAGKYSFNAGIIDSKECLSCQKGKYSSETGMVYENSCKPCEIGKIGIINEATSNDSCILCDSGKYKESLISCLNCPDGWISTDMREFCIICAKGYYSNQRKNYCNECPMGSYNDNEGIYSDSQCKKCPEGKWSSQSANNELIFCKNCLSGLYGDELGMISKGSCKNCPAGKYNNNEGINNINNCKDCTSGTYSKDGSVSCLDCPVGKYVLDVGAEKCLECPEGKFTNNISSVLCKNCPKKSQQNIYKTGCICSQNSYNEFHSNDILNCLECNDTFTCKINTNIHTININKDYWRNTKISTQIYKCKNRFACKGGIISNSSDDLCNEGFKGPLCNVCEKGWAKDDGICLKCPENQGRTMSLTVIIPIVSIIIIIFLIKTANPSNNKKEEVNGVVKIFMNYAQVFSLASSFQINWPTLIRYLFERAKEFSSPRVSFYSSDCVIGWSYYDKLLVYLILPLFYMIGVTIIIFILALCYCKKQKNKIKKMRFTKSQIKIKEYEEKSPSCLSFFIAWEKTAVVVGTFLSWPTIVTKTLEVLNCDKIGDHYYLVKDYSVICYDSKHYTYLTVAYISLILYGLGIPLLGFKLLYNYRYRLYDMHNRYDGSTPLSFLFLGYREKRWYYEFIIMGKKAGLILLSVFLKSYPRYQIIAASLLVQISFFLHVFLRPYDTITSYGIICNRLESISLLSLVMTLSTGLFFGTIDSGYQLGTFEDILIITLILCNGGISLYFFIYFIRLGFKSTVTHVKEHLHDHFKKNRIPCILRCCKISHKNLQALKYWTNNFDNENHGISLKNDLEKEIFSNYFKEKKKKLSIYNEKLDNIKKRRLSVQLDKLRSEIQVMEKERCWQTIQNNRLYNTLKKITNTNQSNLSQKEKDDIKEIYKFYVGQGIHYNERMNQLYTTELNKMVESPHHNTSKTEDIETSSNISSEILENEIVFVVEDENIII